MTKESFMQETLEGWKAYTLGQTEVGKSVHLLGGATCFCLSYYIHESHAWHKADTECVIPLPTAKPQDSLLITPRLPQLTAVMGQGQGLFLVE